MAGIAKTLLTTSYGKVDFSILEVTSANMFATVFLSWYLFNVEIIKLIVIILYQLQVFLQLLIFSRVFPQYLVDYNLRP